MPLQALIYTLNNTFSISQIYILEPNNRNSCCSQTSKLLSADTPRRQKLRKIINTQKQKAKRLRHKLKLKKKNRSIPSEEAIKILETMLPPKVVTFVESQIDLNSKKKNGHRYTNETKAFALSLYHLSGKAYKMISKLFCLPSKSSILKRVSRMPSCSGLTQPSIDVISSKVSMMSPVRKMCVISVDEISIKSHLAYDSSKDEVIGLEDYGDGIKSDCLATSAIVIMARGIVENWKQPVSYYLVNESCSSEKVKEKLVDAINKLEKIGL